MEKTTSFHSSFEAATTDQWKQQLSKELKGITFDELSNIDRNGITIYPFYTKNNSHSVDFIAGNNDWFVMNNIAIDEGAAIANKKILSLLNDGVSGLKINLDRNVDLAELLQDVELSAIHIHFEASSDSILENVRQFLSQQNTPNFFLSHKEKQVIHFEDNLFINGTIYNNAGANSVLENGCLLSLLKENLDFLEANDQLKEINNLAISLATDTNYFEQISKIVALKNTILSLTNEYNIAPRIKISIETSNIYRTINDEANNLLRDTIAAMAGILGGCNDLLINDFSQQNKSLSNRMAKNQQLIFKEEAYLSQVINLIEGSYFIEEYAHELATKSWEFFQKIELEGGYQKALSNNSIPEKIDQQYEQILSKYKSGEKVLIGVNKFPSNNTLQDSLFQSENKYGLMTKNLEADLLH